jgi:hypothetical protein
LVTFCGKMGGKRTKAEVNGNVDSLFIRPFWETKLNLPSCS